MLANQTQQRFNAPRRRVLIVDDHADSACVLAALIAHCGHEVRTAADAAEALKMMAQFAPDIAFIDLGLPDVSGYELARYLRAPSNNHRQQLCLVALTGFGDDQARAQSREAGFDEHLIKPVPLETVQELLARLLGA